MNSSATPAERLFQNSDAVLGGTPMIEQNFACRLYLPGNTIPEPVPLQRVDLWRIDEEAE